MAAWLGVVVAAALAASASAADVLTVTTLAPLASTTVTPEQLNQCGEQTKYDTNDAILKAYNGSKILLQFGGLPGEVDSALEDVDPADMPFVWTTSNASIDYFIDFFLKDPAAASQYNHSLSDNQTFVRVELHEPKFVPIFYRPESTPSASSESKDPSTAMVDKSTEPSTTVSDKSTQPSTAMVDKSTEPSTTMVEKSTVPIKGELWWAPPDLCGYLRTATFRLDDGNLTFTVLRRHCLWRREHRYIQCFGPDAALLSPPISYVGYSGLIASLVG